MTSDEKNKTENNWEILDLMQNMVHKPKTMAQVYVELGPKLQARKLGLNLSQICNDAIIAAVEKKLKELPKKE
jgi:post-segregation antitoxin (ccd killing protein)